MNLNDNIKMETKYNIKIKQKLSNIEMNSDNNDDGVNRSWHDITYTY